MWIPAETDTACPQDRICGISFNASHVLHKRGLDQTEKCFSFSTYLDNGQTDGWNCMKYNEVQLQYGIITLVLQVF